MQNFILDNKIFEQSFFFFLGGGGKGGGVDLSF